MYFHNAGLLDIQINPTTLVVTRFELADQVFDFIQTTHKACQAGLVSRSEAQAWLNELQQLDQFQDFFCSFTGFIVSGEKAVTSNSTTVIDNFEHQTSERYSGL